MRRAWQCSVAVILQVRSSRGTCAIEGSAEFEGARASITRWYHLSLTNRESSDAESAVGDGGSKEVGH